jgi:hypothetical protein
MKSLIAFILINIFFIHSSYGHQLSTAYLKLSDEKESINGELQIRLIDLERKFNLDTNSDGQLTWGETLVSKELISSYFYNVLKFFSAQSNCQSQLMSNWQIDKHFNESYLVLPFNTNCKSNSDLSLAYSGFFDQDTNHKLLIDADIQNQRSNLLINQNNKEVALSSDKSWLETATTFTLEGIIHIGIGYDHILFLLCLLLACTFNKENKNYKLSILTIVSIFTLAHSITLTTTALGWVEFSSRWIEAGIAATVLFSALNNIFKFSKRLLLLTFSFGLLHGFGFASVLGELGIPTDQAWLAVLFFNVGVELGQIIIVLLLMPALMYIRKLAINFQFWLTAGSGLIALISTYWLLQRL